MHFISIIIITSAPLQIIRHLIPEVGEPLLVEIRDLIKRHFLCLGS